jgi:hypothetical protein
MQTWKQTITIGLPACIDKDAAVSHQGIEFLEAGDDFIKARIPSNAHTRQPHHDGGFGLQRLIFRCFRSVAQQNNAQTAINYIACEMANGL